MADKPSSFSEFLKQNQSAPSYPHAKTPDWGSFTATQKANTPEGNAPDFLSWLTDIISRPLYGVTAAVKNQMDAGKELVLDAQKGDIGGAIGAFGKSQLGNLGAAAQGVFSDDPAQHHTTSDLIEYGTDQLGAIDPNYKDVQDNVNPILKGTLGFAGDVALDPLTWIPGAQIAKGAKIALDIGKVAGKGGVGAVKGAVDAVKAAKEIPVAEDVAKAASDVAPEAAEQAVKDVPEAVVAPEAAVVPKAGKSKVAPVAETAPELPPTLGELVRANPRTKKIVSVLDDLNKKVGEKRVQVLPSVETGAQSSVLGQTEWLKEHIALATESPAHSSYIPKSVTKLGFDIPLEDVPGILARQGMNPTKQAVGVELQKRYLAYRQAYAAASGAKKPHVVDALSRPVKPAAPVKPGGQVAVQTLVSQLDRFKEIAVSQQERVEGALGTDLMGQLSRMMSPERFNLVTTKLSDMLKRTDDLSDVGDLAGEPAMRKLFHALGIDPVAVNAARRQAESMVGKVNVMDDEITRRIADPKLGAVASVVDQDILAALPDVVKKNMTELGAYDKVTKEGVLRTEEGVGMGLGRVERSINTHMQWDWFHKLTDRATGRAANIQKAESTTKGLFGAQRAKYVRDEVMPALLKTEELMDQHGFPMYLDYAGERIPLTLGQSLEVMEDGYAKLLQTVLYNKSTSVPSTNLMDAIFFATKHDADWEMVNAQLSKQAKRNGKEGDIPNALTEGGEGQYGFVSKRIAKKPPQSTTDVHYVETPTGWKPMYQADALRAHLTDAIIASVPKLKELALDNAERLKLRQADETFSLVEQQVDELTGLVNDPTRLSEALIGMGHIDSRVSKAAQEAGTLDTSAGAAAEITRVAAPEGAVANADAALTITNKAKKAGKDPAGKKPKEHAEAVAEEGKGTAQKVADREAVEADRLAAEVESAEDFDPSGDSLDWGQSAKTTRYVASGVASKLDPLKEAFNPRFGQKYVYDLQNAGGALAGNWAESRHLALNDISRMFSGLVEGTETPIIKQAFQDVQQGVASSNPQVAAASGAISTWMGKLVDLKGENPILGSSVFRNSIGIEHFNSELERVGLPIIDTDLATRMAKENGTDFLTEAANQWKTWPVEDPLNFMSQFDAVSFRLFTQHSIGQSFVRMAHDSGFASFTPKAGYARVTGSAGSVLAMAIPKNMYLSKDVLAQMKQADEVMRASRQIAGPFGEFVNKYFDPIQSAWKKGITIYRPGHHIRNLVGDQSITWVAEGNDQLRRSVTDAYRVMGLRNQYRDVDISLALRDLGEVNLPTTGEIISSGRHGDITAQGMYDAAQKQGLFRAASVVEDYIDEAATQTGLSRTMQKLSLHNTKLEKVAMGVSEYREHYSRLQHFIQIIHKEQIKGSSKSMQEMIEHAAKEVKKYHPDVSMLTTFELRYMRRLIPFYSWFRGIMPAIVESTAMHPGRVNAFNKASYNLAVSMGIDPNSLSDPFPTDQLFPSFLTDQIQGPQFEVGGQYFGINPGISHWDVLNQFGSNPIRGVAGMVTPLIRTPAELLSGASWGTGAKIKDPSDYLDASLPGLNYLSNITGTSATGSVVSALQGKGLDPQYQVAAGNKNGTDAGLSAFNWLTGLGVNNQSRPNYINYAEIEKRNREGGKTSGF